MFTLDSLTIEQRTYLDALTPKHELDVFWFIIICRAQNKQNEGKNDAAYERIHTSAIEMQVATLHNIWGVTPEKISEVMHFDLPSEEEMLSLTHEIQKQVDEKHMFCMLKPRVTLFGLSMNGNPSSFSEAKA